MTQGGNLDLELDLELVPELKRFEKQGLRAWGLGKGKRTDN